MPQTEPAVLWFVGLFGPAHGDVAMNVCKCHASLHEMNNSRTTYLYDFEFRKYKNTIFHRSNKMKNVF